MPSTALDASVDHAPYIRPHKNSMGASWTFNGDLEKPTFSPSILVKLERTDGGKTKICHSFVELGQIRYLSDCTHHLAGKTIEMPEQD